MNSILEVNADSAKISVSKGFLIIQIDGKDSKVPLSEIESLILNAQGSVLTNQAIMRLSAENIPILHCGVNNQPCAITLPTSGNIYRKERIESQIGMSVPLMKNLWQQVIKAKIANQAAVLGLAGKKRNDLDALAAKVLSGDTGNAEAIAARFYWQRLFSEEFRRDPDLPGINAFLNYSYAILRAAFCRFIAASGLLPELGIHHRNQRDPFCLADDLMEPFRPFADLYVWTLRLAPDAALTPPKKRLLAGLLYLPLTDRDMDTHLRNCIQRTVESFTNSLSAKKANLSFAQITDKIHTRFELMAEQA